jgi:catechol 2,3-dioxygenase-like lactoylglutathione lyase family enzyme
MKMSSQGTPGLPGLRGADHFGFTVPDLKQAVKFFVDVIGCEAFYPLGPFADDEGDWMTRHLNVDPRAKIRGIRLLRCKNGSNFEIFQFEAPDQDTEQPRNSDIGGHHVAFYVDDMDAAVRYLRDRGVRVLGEPTVMAEGSSAGQTWVYFLTPWGMQLELVSYPDGMAYEATTDRRLWHPGS